MSIVGIGQGIPFRRNPFAALFPGPTFALDFARDPYATLHPAFSHVRATPSTLIQQYDGSFVQMLAGEFGLDGGRRVENLLPYSEDFRTSAGWEHLSSTTGVTPVVTPGGDPPPGTNIGSSSRLQCSRSGAGYSLLQYTISSGASQKKNSAGVWARSRTGASQTVYFRCDGDSSTTRVIGTEWTYISVLSVSTDTSRFFSIGTRHTQPCDLSIDIDIAGATAYPQRPGQTEPDPEYVSKGVEILGAEIIPTGEGDGTSFAAWIDASSLPSTAGVSGGAFVGTHVGATVRMRYKITTVPGKQYRLTFHCGADTPALTIGTTAGGAEISSPLVAAGANSIAFTAATDETWLSFYDGSTGFVLDNFSCRSILHHGWGVDGVRWFNTGPDGEDLTDPASGLPVLCTGLATRQQVTNLWEYANASIANLTPKGDVTDVAGSNGLPNGVYFGDNSATRYGYRRLTLTGDHVLQVLIKMQDGSPPTISTLTLYLDEVQDYSPTIEDLGGGLARVWTTRACSGLAKYSGVIKYTGADARQFTVLLWQVHAGTTPKPFVLTDGLSVTVDGDAFPHDITEIGGTEGTWIVEHTAAQSPSVDAGSQTLLDLYADANNRARVYNPSGNLGVQVTDGGVSQWSASDAGANWTAGTLQRLAVRFETDDGSLVTDGDEHLLDASMSVPDATVAYIGGDASSEYSGSIARIAYYGGA